MASSGAIPPASWRRLLLTPLGHERAGTRPQARYHHAVAEPKVVGAGTALSAADAVGTAAIAVDRTDDLTAAVEGARRGDPEAFRILYREAQPRLLRYLTYLVGSEAEDIASETWLQATRDLGKFRGSHGDFRGWITTIARNRAMDHLRRASLHPPAVPVPVEDLAFVAGREDTEDRAIEAITTEEALEPDRLPAARPGRGRLAARRRGPGRQAGRSGRRQACRCHQDRRLPRPEEHREAHRSPP